MFMIFNPEKAKAITETSKVTLAELIARIKERGVEL